ncbi:MAG: GNAT family N-acetyltransferase, partial [Nitrososphaerota archaeon]|nr:GNAT family N-acetyltransferase [Nitrososphaerota archaeon]
HELKAGTVYRQFQAKNGALITLRATLWSDLDSLLEFGNSLVSEFEEDPNLGIGHHQRQTRESEAQWLSNLLADVELERQVSVVASLSDRIVGSGRVFRGRQEDVRHYGELHISVAKEFRDLGLGFQMIQVLFGECKKLSPSCFAGGL